MNAVPASPNPVYRNGITLGLSTGGACFVKLSLLDFDKTPTPRTGFESHQVVEIKVENRLFHRR